MYRLNNSDVGLNAPRRASANSSNNNISAPSHEQNSVNRTSGLLNCSVSHIENQVLSMTNPIVSVVSSSMDLFGPNESSGLQTMNSIDPSISNFLTAPSNASDNCKYGVASTHFAAGTKSKKAEHGSSTKPKSVKRPTDAVHSKSPKKA